MKVATWNLNHRTASRARRARQSEHVEAIGADVWVFTEAYTDFSPGEGYKCVAASADASDQSSPRGRWVVIWSRLPARPVKVSADLERCASVRLADGGVVVVGTVLPWLTDTRRGFAGTAGFKACLTEQAADWKRLQQQSGGRLCVAGDFNQDLLPSGHYYGGAERRRALRDALVDCGLRCLTGGADDPLRDAPDGASIDHICVGPGLRPSGHPPARVWPKPGKLGRTLSDHYGVWAEVELA